MKSILSLRLKVSFLFVFGPKQGCLHHELGHVK